MGRDGSRRRAQRVIQHSYGSSLTTARREPYFVVIISAFHFPKSALRTNIIFATVVANKSSTTRIVTFRGDRNVVSCILTRISCYYYGILSNYISVPWVFLFISISLPQPTKSNQNYFSKLKSRMAALMLSTPDSSHPLAAAFNQEGKTGDAIFLICENQSI